MASIDSQSLTDDWRRFTAENNPAAQPAHPRTR